MAATNPQQRPDPDDGRYGRPTVAPTSTTTPARRSRWMWIAIGILVLAVIGVIAYMALYSGGSGYGGGGSSGGGGYFVLGFSAEQARRIRNRIVAKG